ncbi:glycosyltransferase family 2 protein [Notoacmeibacter marinus]|uniref:glycosyltransferase family 2 protein n=1 Tax=Notoacmeibacter marinus TaxID=1876515 RepID=UPI000DF24170|nr:glycosyltransferase family 2 protein [Notoacmeibacter marinus]
MTEQNSRLALASVDYCPDSVGESALYDEDPDGAARKPAGASNVVAFNAAGSFQRCAHHDRLIIRVLILMGWKATDLRDAIDRARRNRTGLEDAVLSNTLFDRTKWSRFLAQESGLPQLKTLKPENLVLPSAAIERLLACRWQDIAVGYRLPDGRYRRLVPDSVSRAHRLPSESRDESCLVAGPVLRRALIDRLSAELEERARNKLFVDAPDFSARHLTNAWQSFVLGALAVSLAIGLVATPTLVMLAVHILSSTFFLSCMALRLAAVPHAGAKKPRLNLIGDRDELPVYTVLVALYQEADMVGQLLTALGQLRWPTGKLEIRLICEADDRETIEAIHALRPPAHVEVLEVPPGAPRTKPRALNFALPTCRGEYVCLYDAEDRPHPDQLMEAYQTFRDGPAELGCLQAPLIVTNGNDHWLARQFAFEYAALFRGILPFLAASRSVLPLGGTSNHFRRAVLDEVGGWDPYNVTEDADLGMRMARAGYRSGVIDAPTLEDAPDNLKTWLPQRTRWLKGWMVCWLVHNRHPRRLWRELGGPSFFLSQILLSGIPGAALLLPVMLFSALYLLGHVAISSEGPTTLQLLLYGIDFTNFAMCIGAYLWLGTKAATMRERASFATIWAGVPAYWLLQSVAAWRAAFQLVRQRAHIWEKTAHKPTVDRFLPRRLKAWQPESRLHS